MNGQDTPLPIHIRIVCSVMAPYGLRLRAAWLLLRYLVAILNPLHAGGTMVVSVERPVQADLRA